MHREFNLCVLKTLTCVVAALVDFFLLHKILLQNIRVLGSARRNPECGTREHQASFDYWFPLCSCCE